MSRIFLVLLLALLAGCGPEKTTAIDQCLRVTLFTSCMRLLPAGPASAKYNDWDEVVAQCDQTAVYQSIRRIEHIKPECRP